MTSSPLVCTCNIKAIWTFPFLDYLTLLVYSSSLLKILLLSLNPHTYTTTPSQSSFSYNFYPLSPLPTTYSKYSSIPFPTLRFKTTCLTRTNVPITLRSGTFCPSQTGGGQEIFTVRIGTWSQLSYILPINLSWPRGFLTNWLRERDLTTELGPTSIH